MEFRKANQKDIHNLVTLRKTQLIDEGIEPNQDIDEELYQFFNKKLQDGSLIQWIVVEKDSIIATGAIIFYDFPPSFTNKSGRKGYLSNMYTKAEYRGQGIATKLLDTLVKEAQDADVSKLWLGASTLGKPVYKKFGFNESNEWMELSLT
ncbi:GNAT family N-acetyltransferase [Ornithinibacillus xuwenensis]|uniref:GNAT family N-acetyltransferase n=1 Tax=Ornithinibacillus xuwenensis TaxID=3144668 RepID=A0ABU9XDJ4_9BACI